MEVIEENVDTLKEYVNRLNEVGRGLGDEESRPYREAMVRLSYELGVEGDIRDNKRMVQVAEFLEFSLLPALYKDLDSRKKNVVCTVLDDLIAVIETDTYYGSLDKNVLKYHEMLLKRYGLDHFEEFNWTMGVYIRQFDRSKILERKMKFEGKVEEGILKGFELGKAKEEMYGSSYSDIYLNVKQVVTEIHEFLKEKDLDPVIRVGKEQGDPFVTVGSTDIFPIVLFESHGLELDAGSFPLMMREGLREHGRMDHK